MKTPREFIKTVIGFEINEDNESHDPCYSWSMMEDLMAHYADYVLDHEREAVQNLKPSQSQES